MQDKRQGNLLVWVGIAALVVIVLFIIFWKPAAQAPTVPNGTAAFAPAGQLTPQFPKELVLDSNPAIANSYAIIYSTSTSQYTAVWNSSTSLATLLSDYQNYLPQHGWTITNTMKPTKTIQGISAESTSATLLVSIVDQTASRKVAISYVTK